MTLFARDHRVLGEIENELAAAEPRLDRALVQARLPVLRRRSTVISDDTESGRIWVVAICGSLLVGLGLLTAGLLAHAIALLYAGAPLAQFSPVTLGYFGKRADRSRRQPVNHRGLFALLGR